MDQKQVTPERIMQMSWGYAAPLILEAAIRNEVDLLELIPALPVRKAGPVACAQDHRETS